MSQPWLRSLAAALSMTAIRKSPAPSPALAIGGARVVRVLDELACRHGRRAEIVLNDGSEFTGRALFACSAQTGARLPFLQPGGRSRTRSSRASSAGSGTSA